MADLSHLSDQELLNLAQTKLSGGPVKIKSFNVIQNNLNEPQGMDTKTSEAFNRGLTQGASLGLVKGGRSFAGGLYEAINPEPEQKALSFSERLTRGMLSESGKEKKQTEKIKKEHPYAYGAGNIVGGLVPTAPALAGSVPALITGAVAGAIESHSEEKDPLIGAALGTGGALLGIGAAKGLQKVGSSLKKMASEKVLKALKMAPTTMRRLMSKGNVLGKATQIADDMVKQGVADDPVSLRKLYEKTVAAMKDVGPKVGSLYDEAAKTADGFSLSELKDVAINGMSKGQKFASPEEFAPILNEVTKGLEEKFGNQGLADLIAGKPQSKLNVKEVWEKVVDLDKLSRQWQRASDPVFGSKADAMIDAANAIRGAIVKKIEAVNPELAKEIAVSSGAYRNLSLVESSLSDQVIREFSQNRSIPRMTLTEAVSDILPGTPGRLGAAKLLRGASEVTGMAGKLAPSAGIRSGRK